jgi:3-dehydroquinate synthase
MSIISEIVPVLLENNRYDIIIAAGVLQDVVTPIQAVLTGRRCVVVSDVTVAPLYADSILKQLAAAGYVTTLITINSGDKRKNFNSLQHICEKLLDFKVDRNCFLIALGGGVIGDITGLAASLILRGIPYIQIPTTLLAQVDSSVGGKTAINMPQGKNLVGAFYQPSLVLIDSDVLKTIEKRDVLAGYAEILKYGLINDAAFFAWLEAHGAAVCALDAAAVQYAVATSCRAKADIVAKDEKETSGLRALLNLGHTFGHALEAAVGYSDTVLHGEAVAMGCLMAFQLSVDLGQCPPQDLERLKQHQQARGYALTLPALADFQWNAENLLELMALDKKVADQKKTFVLARGIGASYLDKTVEDASIINALNKFIKV